MDKRTKNIVIVSAFSFLTLLLIIGMLIPLFFIGDSAYFFFDVVSNSSSYFWAVLLVFIYLASIIFLFYKSKFISSLSFAANFACFIMVVNMFANAIDLKKGSSLITVGGISYLFAVSLVLVAAEGTYLIMKYYLDDIKKIFKKKERNRYEEDSF